MKDVTATRIAAGAKTGQSSHAHTTTVTRRLFNAHGDSPTSNIFADLEGPAYVLSYIGTVPALVSLKLVIFPANPPPAHDDDCPPKVQARLSFNVALSSLPHAHGPGRGGDEPSVSTPARTALSPHTSIASLSSRLPIPRPVWITWLWRHLAPSDISCP